MGSTTVDTEEYMLSTYDNPYSPFDEFDQWQTFDEKVKGYNTCEYLDRIVTHLEESGLHFSDDDNKNEEELIQFAINDIVNENVLGIYIKLNKTQANKIKERRINN